MKQPERKCAMNLNNNTNTSFKGIPYEPSLQALNNLKKKGNSKFVDNLLKYYKPLKESEVVDFFIKEENGKIVDAYTKLKKPLQLNNCNILDAGTEIRSCASVGDYKNGTATIPVQAPNNPDLVLGGGGLPERIAKDAVGIPGTPYFDNNPALAYIIDLHDKLKNIFQL